MAKLLGIDVGTSGCKLLLINEQGKVLNQASAEYPISYPRPLWAEQNPEDWWAAVQRCLSEIGEKPDAIGLTGQMHGAVFLDEKDHAVRPAILWNDQRTSEECAEMDRTIGPERLRRITRNPPLTGFQAPKVLWLRNHELSKFLQVRSVLLPKDYIRLKLTGEKATDVSDASGTGLFDVSNRVWSLELMAELELDPGLFPRAYESSAITAPTSQGVPVVAGAGDQAAAATGTGAVRPGIVSVSLGTSGVVFTAQETPAYDELGRAHTFCHTNGKWHSMGVMLSCGGALSWFRNTFCPGESYDDLASRAEQGPVGCEGLTFLPYLAGERTPHNDPNARAAFAGATMAHGPDHFARAVFEGATFGLLDCYNLIARDAAEIRVTSGGSKSRFWMQMLADVFQRPCVTLEVDQGPAYGAALLAGVGIGIWTSVEHASELCGKVKEAFEPRQMGYERVYDRYQKLYKDLREWNVS